MNFDTMRKISNQKNGRDFLVKKNLVPSLLNNIKKCADHENPQAVINGFSVLDNLSRDEAGKEAIKEANAMEILSDVLNTFDNDERVLKMGAKIYSKISKEEDMRQQLEIVKNCDKKIQTDPNQDNLKELEKALILVSNLMLVEDIGKVACEDDNYKMLMDLYDHICKLDLTGKSPDYLKTYTMLNKYFMVVFQRIFAAVPEILDKNSEKGKQSEGLFKNIQNSVIKIREGDQAGIDKLEADKDTTGGVEMLTKSFREYFTSFDDNLIQFFQAAKPDENELDPNLIKVLEYVIEHVIGNGKKYFGVDEKANYAASRILKLASEVVKRYPTVSQTLPPSLEKTFPYMKSVVNISEYLKTLNNDFDVVKDLISGEETEQKKQIKQDIIPVTVNFMNTKPKYRYPNYVNMNILDIYLTPDFVNQLNNSPDVKANPNFGLNYVNPIVSVMSKAFFETSTVLKVVGSSEDKDNELGDNNMEIDEALEQKINDKGCELLIRLVTPEEFLKQVKIFKSNASSYKPGLSGVDDIIALEGNLFYQHCMLSTKQFFELGMADDLETVRDLIKKEIAYIESFKRDKANESNPKYKEITEGSNKRLKVQLGLLKKIEDNCIKNYLETKDEKYVQPLRDITQTNLDIFDKSTDSKNLIEQLAQFRKNLPFIKDNEALLKVGKVNNTPTLEKYINTLMNLFRKSIDDEDLDDNIIKTFITLTKKKPESCNLLVKAGCPRLLLQVMENTQNNKLANNALELLKIITLSSEENLIMVGNQNILSKLFEIRAKFANDENITKGCDFIANEIMKLPGQEAQIAEVVKDAIAEFHENMKEDFKNVEVKQKILGNLETINAFTSNKKIIEASLMTDEFRDDLNKAIDLTNKDDDISQINEDLLTNEMAILKKIKECLPETDDAIPKHDAITDNVLKVIKNKSNYGNIFLTTIKLLGDYVQNENLYNKCVDKKIDNAFVDQLFDISENYLDNPEISKEINNILCYLCLRNPELADYIVQRGGLANVIEELKATVNLNDENSKQLKLNGLKMLNSLLKTEKNLEMFTKAHGVDLINNIVKNEVTIAPEIKDNDSLLKTRETINTKTPEMIAEEEKQGNAEEKKEEESYFVHCLKIMQKGIEKGQKEFVDDKNIKNITMLAEANYPNKYLFNEVAGILANQAVEIPDNVNDNMSLLKLAYSNKAKYYCDGGVRDKVKAIEDKIAAMTMKPEKYKFDLKKQIEDDLDKQDLAPKEINNLLTYISLAIDSKDFDDVATADKDDIVKFYNHVQNLYKNKSEDENEKNPNVDEGVVLSMMKLANYLLDKGFISKDDPEVVDSLINMGKPLYVPENYIFVDEYNKEMDKLLSKYGKIDEAKSEPDKGRVKYTDVALNNLQHSFNKTLPFLEDYHKELKTAPLGTYPDIQKTKEDNLDKIIDNTNDYYKTEEDVNFKEPQAKKLCDTAMDIIDDLKKEGVIKKEPTEAEKEKNEQIVKRLTKMWDMIHNVLNQDISNTIPANEELVGNMMDKLGETIAVGANDVSLRDVPKILSSKMENNDDVNDKILNFAADDLIKNEENKDIKAKDLETIANLSKYSGPMKNIMKNDKLWTTLKNMYAKEDDLNNRALLSEIFRNATKNNFTIENLINNDADAIKLIFNKVLTDTIKNNDTTSNTIANNEVDSVCDILKDNNNFKTLTDKQLLTDDDMKKLEEAYKDNEKQYNKIKPLLDQIAEQNKAKAEKLNLENDENLLKELGKIVEEAFKEHMTELENCGNDAEKADLSKQKNMVTTESNVIQNASSIRKGRLSLITATLLFNPNNEKVKSLLSVKNNNDMPQTLEQILALLRKLYNEMKTSQDEELNKKRAELIVECLRLLKSLSLSPDNHKPILEVGLVNFMEKLAEEKNNNISFNVGSKDTLKNCSNSENAVPVILDSPILNNLIMETLELYDHPEVLSSDPNMKKIFLCDNITFSNICKNKKGFEAVFKMIGLEKLILLGKKTGNVDLLEAIITMLINYLRHTNKEELPDQFWSDVLLIVNKCLNLKDRTPSLIAKTLILISLMFMPKLIPFIEQLDIINHLNYDFDKFKDEKEFLNASLRCLSVITNDNAHNAKDCVNSGLITKLKNEVSQLNQVDNEDIIINLTSLYNSLVLNNMDNVEAFCKLGITDNTLFWLESFAPKVVSSQGEVRNVTHATINLDMTQNMNKEEQPTQAASSKKDKCWLVKGIMQNSISTLDSITISNDANIHLSGTKFTDVVTTSLENKANEIPYITTALHALGNHLYTEAGDNINKLNLEELYQLLKALQKEYYSNSDILTNINYISGSLLKTIKNNDYISKFFDLISESTKCQDWNVPLIIMALKSMHEGLIKHSFLIDEVFDDTVPNLFNLLKLYKDNADIQVHCYKILALFAKNGVYSYSMVNSGLMDNIKETLDNPQFKNSKKAKAMIRPVVFGLLNVLSMDEANSKKISDDLMASLLKEISEEGYNEDTQYIVELLSALLKHKYCIQPFIQYKGLEEAISLLKDNDTNVDLILDVFHILSSIANAGDEYKFMMQQLKLPDLINKIIQKAGMYEKKIEYEGRSLIFLINMAKVKLEVVDDIDFTDIKIVNPIKPEVKNFLTSGKQLKIINSNGDVKQMQLMFSQDLLKITAKKIKSNLPPKPKYVIETSQIKQIVKGHGTDAFKKSKGIFRSIPKPEVCFSIIGPTTLDGVKAINVQCETEADVDKWLNYMEIVVNHFKKTKTIKSQVVIKK